MLEIRQVEGWTDPEPPEAILERVIAVVCKTWGVTREELLGTGRVARVVDPRFAMYALARKATGLPLVQIGIALGRDHKAIWYGVKVTTDRIATEPRFAAAYRAAEARLGIAS